MQSNKTALECEPHLHICALCSTHCKKCCIHKSTMVPSCYWLLRYTALVFILYASTVGASSKCEILKASLRYTQEDAPTDLSGVVSQCVLVNCVERGMGVLSLLTFIFYIGKQTPHVRIASSCRRTNQYGIRRSCWRRSRMDRWGSARASWGTFRPMQSNTTRFNKLF